MQKETKVRKQTLQKQAEIKEAEDSKLEDLFIELGKLKLETSRVKKARDDTLRAYQSEFNRISTKMSKVNRLIKYKKVALGV